MRGGRILLKADDGGFDAYFAIPEAAPYAPLLDHAVLLGQSARGPVLAVPVGVEPEALPETIKAIDYRSVNVQDLIDPEALGALAQGAALLAWHASHGFCGKCGGPTEMRAGGYERFCLNCQSDIFRALTLWLSCSQ